MSRLFKEPKLVLATHNPGKVVEIADLLKPFGIEVVSAGELELPEPEETETTFEGNARLKAHAAAKAADLPALADDSGTLSIPGTAFNASAAVLNLTTKDVLDHWESCEDGEEAQAIFLGAMNQRSARRFRFLCRATAKEWRSQTQVDLTIDAVEEIE